MKRIFVILLTAVVSLGALAQLTAPKVSVKFERDTIQLGDQIKMWVLIDKDLAQDVAVPEFEGNRMIDGKIEILENPRLDTLEREGRRLSLRLEYLITSFDAGRYVIKDFPIVVGVEPKFDTVKALDSAMLMVTSFEIDTTTMQIYDIKQPMNTPVTWAEVAPYVWWGLLAVLGVGGLVWGFLWWRKRRQAAIEAAKEPLHIRIIKQLEELHAQKLWLTGQTKEYFSELADILRHYIEERYGVETMEMTSFEILGAITKINDPKQVEQLMQFFSLSDLVKFAKLQPDPAECETAYFDVYYYVDQTKEQPITEENETPEA